MSSIPHAVLESLPRIIDALEARGERVDGLQIVVAGAPYEPSSLAPVLAVGEWAALAPWLGRAFEPAHRVVAIDPGGGSRDLTLGALPNDAEAVVFLPACPSESPSRGMTHLRGVMHRLRAPGGCPWDAEQTHRSLIRYLVEETHEVVDAIEQGSPAELREELGDVLLQVLFHAEVASETGAFDFSDVVAGISDKLIRRHPHVFGDLNAEDAAAVEQAWEQIKRREKASRTSALDGVPRSLPGLAKAREIQKRLVRAGFNWPDAAGPIAKLHEEVDELAAATDKAAMEGELGDVLYMLVRVAADRGVDLDAALRGTNARVERRFRHVEERLAEAGKLPADVGLPELERLWTEAKTRGA
jgi:MazG family protein